MSSNTFSAPGIDAPDRTPPWDITTLELSHPKNYLGVPLAVAADGDTGHLIATHLVEMVGAAKLGARTFGYLDTADTLTLAGETLSSCASLEWGSPTEALGLLGDVPPRRRFTDELPAWRPIIEQTFSRRSPLNRLLTLVNAHGGTAISLPEFVDAAAESDPSLIGTTFLRDRADTWTAEAIRAQPLAETQTYSSYAISQFKTSLFHAGFLTERGADTSRHDPGADIWALTDRAGRLTTGQQPLLEVSDDV